MDITIIKPTPTDLEEIQAKNDESVSPEAFVEKSTPDQISSIAARQALEIDTRDGEYDGKIETLVQWAKEQVGNEDPIKIKWAIKDLAIRVGTPTFGDRIKHVARFAYLDMEEKRIKRQKADFI